MATSVSHLPAPYASDDNRSVAVGDLVDRARKYAEQSQSANTRRAYAAGIRDFGAFCGAHGLQSYPAEPQTVALYATHLAASKRVSTLRQRLAAISVQHRRAGLESPCSHRMVREVLNGVARQKGTVPTRKAALTLEPLRALLLAIDGDDVAAKRDRAILLLGFGGALRRSELAALRVEDLRFTNQGLLVRIIRSKTDPFGEGQEVAVPFLQSTSLCAVKAVRAYLEASGLKSGPLFRSLTFSRELTDHSIAGVDVANLVKRLARRAHVDGDFSGHSLRAGFATAAAHARVSLDSIARTTRHKSLAVLMTYVRPAQAFNDTALSSIVA
jgi:integrase